MFNQCAVPGCWHACDTHTKHTAVQEHRWEQVMTCGPEAWRPLGIACDFTVELGAELEANMEVLATIAHTDGQVLCLRMAEGAPVEVVHHVREHHSLLASCPLTF
jgi:hypothetical protein